MDIITQKIKDIEEYIPNTTEYRIRLDANESPFTPSDEIIADFKKALDTLNFNRYPDPYASKLVDEFAKKYEINAVNVIAGNGSDELISLIASGFTSPGDVVTVVSPDFSMYDFYSTYAGAKVCIYHKDDDMTIDFSKLKKMVDENRSKIVIFSNPCNPTGQIARRSEIETFIRNVDALVVVDEAYMEFAQTDENMIKYAADYKNLIVLKTLSKAFGAASMRLGFAIANIDIIGAIRKIKSPYNVNTISQIFGRIILKHSDEIEKKVSIIKENTQYLYDKLVKIKTSSVFLPYKTSANFVYIKLSSPDDAKFVTEHLHNCGIAIRCMTSAGCIRVTAGAKAEIDETVEKIAEALL